MDLVIMAAGMGSRFGGLKQLTPMGPNGEFLIDYSIYDAKEAGFDRIVFIIKKENYELFQETIGNRVEKSIPITYVFQDKETIPVGYKVPETREKPLGTGHAIYCCKDVVKNNFAVINADDFYGKDAFFVAARFLKESTNYQEFGVVGYPLPKVLGDHGAVKRGVIEFKEGYLTNLVESSCEEVNGQIVATPLDGREAFTCSPDTLASMNFLLFTPYIFDLLEKDIRVFLSNPVNLEKGEFLLPDVVCDHIHSDDIKVRGLSTTASWFGVTYKEDTPKVQASIVELIQKGDYPNELWK